MRASAWGCASPGLWVSSALRQLTCELLAVKSSLLCVSAANVQHRPGFTYGTLGGIPVSSEGQATWTWNFFLSLVRLTDCAVMGGMLCQASDWHVTLRVCAGRCGICILLQLHPH